MHVKLVFYKMIFVLFESGVQIRGRVSN